MARRHPPRHATPVLVSETLSNMTRDTRVHIARAALRSARRVKSVPVRTAKQLRDLASTVDTIDLQGERGESRITLNVLNVNGDMLG
jgi:hypothetical protein